MAYTKNSWSNGQVIDANRLNHMEDGIESANSGASAAVISLSATGFNSATHTFGMIVYAYFKNNGWWIFNDNFATDPYILISGYATPFQNILPPLLIPGDGTVYPFLAVPNGITVTNTGGINSTSQGLLYSFGSSIAGYNFYRISGSGSVQFNG